MAMTPLDRKIKLLRNRKLLKVIARDLGVTPLHVSYVNSGKRRSPRVEQAIADAIGKPVSAVFPPQPVPKQRKPLVA